MLDNRKIEAIKLIMMKQFTLDEVATKVGVSRTTLWEWRNKDKEFVAELARSEREFETFKHDVSKKMFAEGLKTAISTLEDIMKQSKNDNARVSAATTWLDRGLGKVPTKLEVKEDTQDSQDDETIIDNEVTEWEVSEENHVK